MSQPNPAAEIVFPEGLAGLPNLVHHRLSLLPETELFEMTCGDDPSIGFIAAPGRQRQGGHE